MTNRNLITLLLLFAFGLGLTAQDLPVMTYNIRFDNPGDGLDRWDLRKEAVADFVKAERPAILGTQEGQPHQLDYLDEHLPNYDYVGVGRDHGDKTGEHVGLYYDTSALDLLHSGTFWLSEKGDTGSLGWDAVFSRICTYGLFSQKSSGKQFKVYNAHFDHVGVNARNGSATQIADSALVNIKSGIPVIVLGDFNSEPESEAFRILNDAISCAAEQVDGAPTGPSGTFTAFNTSIDPVRRIDFIFVSGFDVKSYAHLDPRTHEGRAASDHLPVAAALTFE